jgi:hypothetical protein
MRQREPQGSGRGWIPCWQQRVAALAAFVRGSGFLEGPGLKHLRRDRQPFIHAVRQPSLFEFVDAASPNWHLGDNLEQSQVWADRSPNTFKN